MCGIALCTSAAPSGVQEAVWADIQKRGPDRFDTYVVEDEARNQDIGEGNGMDFPPHVPLAVLGGAVLHIQGDELASQPMHDTSGGCLLWNGEIFGGLERRSDVIDGDVVTSDTCLVSAMLAETLSEIDNRNESDELTICTEIATKASLCLATIEGPYAFIYFHRASQTVVYGRDPFGRRSLVGLKDTNISTGGYVAISSTTGSGSDLELGEMVWEELTVGGVYAQCLTPTQVGHGKVVQVPWPTSRLKLGLQFNTSPSPLIPSSQGCRDSTITISEHSRQQQDRNDMEEAAAAQFLSIFKSVLLNRINLVHDISRTDQNMDAKGTLSSTSPVGVLFSGGIDSVFLTAVLHLCLPMELSIDLINVSFEGPCNESSTQRETPSPDRLAAIAAYGELQCLYPTRTWRLVHVDVKPDERDKFEQRIIGLIQPQSTHMDLNIGTAFWFASRGQGHVSHYTTETIESAYGVVQDDGRPLLRKGGEGYAQGRGEKVRPNTAATQLNKVTCTKPGQENSSIVFRSEDDASNKRNKDRVECCFEGCTQISKPGCLYDLCKRCCVKRFKAENAALHAVPDTNHSQLEQCPVHKKKSKACKEELGISEQAESTNATSATFNNVDFDMHKTPYQSHCKILLVGIGADEQLAGYSRHRTVYQRGGVGALVQELNMDTARIYTRNLGRDDRCISDHGKEAWFPFLDEKVVRFLQETPLDLICNLNEPQGEGDKKILRKASQSLGLQSSTLLVKRAIQFGTRVAKHTNVKYHGSNRSGKGTTIINNSTT